MSDVHELMAEAIDRNHPDLPVATRRQMITGAAAAGRDGADGRSAVNLIRLRVE